MPLDENSVDGIEARTSDLFGRFERAFNDAFEVSLGDMEKLLALAEQELRDYEAVRAGAGANSKIDEQLELKRRKVESIKHRIREYRVTQPAQTGVAPLSVDVVQSLSNRVEELGNRMDALTCGDAGGLTEAKNAARGANDASAPVVMGNPNGSTQGKHFLERGARIEAALNPVLDAMVARCESLKARIDALHTTSTTQ
jgi:hypothetical protein